MGRLTADGVDALLVTKVKVLLRKAFEAGSSDSLPSTRRRRSKAPTPTFEAFVRHLDIDDPVAVKAIELLAKDVFERERKRRAALDAVVSTTAAGAVRRSLTTASNSNPAHSTAVHQSVLDEIQAHLDGGSNGSNIRSSSDLEAHHFASRAWDPSSSTTGNPGGNSGITVETSADVETLTARTQRTQLTIAQARQQEAREYDAIIADAQRRVASPLPAPYMQVPSTSSALESFWQDPSSSTPSSSWYRHLPTSSENPLPWYSPPPPPLDMLNSDVPLSRQNAPALHSTGIPPLDGSSQEVDYYALNDLSRQMMFPDGELERERDHEADNDIEDDEGEDDPSLGNHLNSYFESWVPRAQDNDDNAGRLDDLERAIGHVQQYMRVADQPTPTDGSSQSRLNSTVAARHAIIERLERRRRQRAEERGEEYVRRPEIANYLNSNIDDGRPTSSIRATSTIPMHFRSHINPMTASLPIIVGGDFSDVPSSSLDTTATFVQQQTSSTVSVFPPDARPVARAPQRAYSIRRSGYHASAPSASFANTLHLPQTSQSPLLLSRTHPRSPLARASDPVRSTLRALSAADVTAAVADAEGVGPSSSLAASSTVPPRVRESSFETFSRWSRQASRINREMEAERSRGQSSTSVPDANDPLARSPSAIQRYLYPDLTMDPLLTPAHTSGNADVESISELLGSSSSAAALGGSTSTSTTLSIPTSTTREIAGSRRVRARASPTNAPILQSRTVPFDLPTPPTSYSSASGIEDQPSPPHIHVSFPPDGAFAANEHSASNESMSHVPLLNNESGTEQWWQSRS